MTNMEKRAKQRKEWLSLTTDPVAVFLVGEVMGLHPCAECGELVAAA